MLLEHLGDNGTLSAFCGERDPGLALPRGAWEREEYFHSLEAWERGKYAARSTGAEGSGPHAQRGDYNLPNRLNVVCQNIQ